MADGAVRVVILAWLGIGAYWDLRSRQMPSWWWNLIPLLGAALRAGLRDGWIAPAAALSAVLLPRPWFLLSLLGLPLDPRPIPILAGVTFRMAWERGWMGGADACAMLALLLIFPDPWMLALLFLSLAAVGLIFRRRGERRFPGLLGILAAAALRIGLGI